MQDNSNNISDEELSEFIEKNKLKYLYKFTKFKIKNDGFVPTWHWPAFFFGPLWFLYRKLYIWAALTMVIAFMPIGQFMAQLAYGMCANYIYYKDSLKKVSEIKAHNTDLTLSRALKEAGGVHRWVTWTAVAIVVLTPVAGYYYHGSVFEDLKLYHHEIIITPKNPIEPQPEVPINPQPPQQTKPDVLNI